MSPGIPPRDQDLVRRLVLVDVVGGGDALLHAVADPGQIAAFVEPEVVCADAAVSGVAYSGASCKGAMFMGTK